MFNAVVNRPRWRLIMGCVLFVCHPMISRSAKLEHDHSFVVGSVLGLTGPSSALAREVRHGLDLRIKQANEEGGINGRKIELITLDDNYQPEQTVKQYEKLVNTYHTNTVLCPVGTPTLEGSIDYIVLNKMLVLFPFTGSDIARQQSLHNIINIRSSYSAEAQQLARYAVQELGKKRVALFYQDDSYGHQARNAAVKELVALGISDVLDVPYERTNKKLTAQVTKIKEFNPDTLMLFSTKNHAQILIKKMEAEQLPMPTLMAISFTTDALRTSLQRKRIPLIISRVVPDPAHCDLPIAQEYRNAIKKYTPKFRPKADSFEAYIATSLFIDAAASIKGAVTTEKIIRYFSGMKKFNYKGIPLSFDPVSQSLTTNMVWLDTGDRQWGCVVE